jgi:propionyl-CoA carboxylase beta chain
MSIDEKLEILRRKNAEAERGGGQDKVDRQHAAGRLTARERLAILLDEGSFTEIDKQVLHRCRDFGMEEQRIPGDGVVTGHGTVDGRLVYVFAQDFTVFGGSLSKTHAEKIVKVMDMALRNGAPIVGLNDSGGARIQEGVESLAGYSDIFLRNMLGSGVVPQISAIMGPCAGGAVYSPALTDFVLMVKDTSYMFITGPDVIRAVTHEEVSKEALGGAMTHNTRSGCAHFACGNDEECLLTIRELLSFLPGNNKEDPPVRSSDDPVERTDETLNRLIPDNPNLAYDMRALLRSVADEGHLLEVQELFASNLVTAFARIGGRSVGFVANQPSHLAGALDVDASLKGARFVRFCDCFNIPLVFFEDVPGFLPGVGQELGGIIKHGAKLLYAIAEATVPRVTVIARKAYGGAYCVMNSRNIRGDYVFAFPTAEVAVMGSEGAVNIIHRTEISRSRDPETRRAELVADYRERFANPYNAAELGYVDEIIEPALIRPRLARALDACRNKRDSNPPRKHGNIPL